MPRLAHAASALMTALSLLVAGCSDDEAHLKELARYTPEILSEEVLTRYKASLKRPRADARAKAAAKSGRDVDGDKEREIVDRLGPEALSHDAPADGKGMSLDELAASTARKAGLIEGQSLQEVLSKLSTAVEADPGLPDAEKDKLKDALHAAFKAAAAP
ncbi:hypothetical protein [Paludisphaera sp.]|uniref:hypothetical protein n=1 Tax=Paludisphaera sp. TaxID=2017432 RepID=UPI00301BD76B